MFDTGYDTSLYKLKRYNNYKHKHYPHTGYKGGERQFITIAPRHQWLLTVRLHRRVHCTYNVR